MPEVAEANELLDSELALLPGIRLLDDELDELIGGDSDPTEDDDEVLDDELMRGLPSREDAAPVRPHRSDPRDFLYRWHYEMARPNTHNTLCIVRSYHRSLSPSASRSIVGP